MCVAVRSSSLIQDLKEEYLDTPTEVSAGSRAQQIMSKAQKEKEEYEEAYLTRLPVTKTEKHRQRRLTTLGECVRVRVRGRASALTAC